MADEVRANPPELGRAAQLSLTESEALFDALRQARGEVPLAAEAIGNTARTGTVATAHTELVETAGTTVERLIAVLEHDVEALYQTAFAYQKADRDAAADLARQHRNIPM
jgi:hypothetical protein